MRVLVDEAHCAMVQVHHRCHVRDPSANQTSLRLLNSRRLLSLNLAFIQRKEFAVTCGIRLERMSGYEVRDAPANQDTFTQLSVYSTTCLYSPQCFLNSECFLSRAGSTRKRCQVMRLRDPSAHPKWFNHFGWCHETREVWYREGSQLLPSRTRETARAVSLERGRQPELSSRTTEPRNLRMTSCLDMPNYRGISLIRKPPTPLGTPQGPRHRPTVGS